jgi:AraC-like DNA-binding protein
MTYEGGVEPTPVAARVESAVRMSIPHHGRKLRKRVAQQLAMSERTLARRLAEEGTTFTHICDRVRFDLAVELLSRGLPVTVAALDCGYSDCTALCHAMLRWTGTSPRKAMRRAA